MNDLYLLEENLLALADPLIKDMKRIKGNILLLGAGGKMGPSLSILAKKAMDKAGLKHRVIAVSRFSDTALRNQLEAAGVETISADLLNDAELQSLPLAPHVIYLAGHKFGTTGKESFTWAMNAYLPGRVAEKYKQSRIVAFSTGNVLPFVPIHSGGLSEEAAPAPLGEYGQSCLGRERIFQYFSELNQTPILIYRLNYAVDFRYGVALEIAKSVQEGRAIDLSTGNVNMIWQGDANEIALRSLLHCGSPAKILNVTGPEIVSVRWLAHQFAAILGKEPVFINEEQHTAVFSNPSEVHRLFAYPSVSIKQIIEITKTWMKLGGAISGKATHFQEREGKF